MNCDLAWAEARLAEVERENAQIRVALFASQTPAAKTLRDVGGVVAND